MSDKPIDRLSVPSFVDRASRRYSIEEIEAGLVSGYLSYIGKSTKNTFLHSVMNGAACEDFSRFAGSNGFHYDLISIMAAFEFLVETERKSQDGVVYTPESIVNYIVDNTIDALGSVLDPSCGGGAFLVGAMRRLRDITKLSLKNIAERYLHGKDISERAVRHSCISILLYMIGQGEDYEGVTLDIAAEDSVELLGKQYSGSYKSKYNFVIGNPPYVKLQDLDNHRKTALETYSKVIGGYNFNLYFAFIELGFNALTKDGKLGYIIPNNFFTTFAARKLRRFLLEGRKVSKILNFNHLSVFPGSSTYTCILILDESRRDNCIDYSYLQGQFDPDKLENLHFEKVSIEEGKSGKWRLLGPKDIENISKIESAGTPLGEKFRISVGIATLKDEVYLVKEKGDSYCHKDHRGTDYPIEKGITRRIVKVSSVNNEGEIEEADMRIIFPYKREKNGRFSLISEDRLKYSYPLCYSYLLVRRKELEMRDKARRGFPAWYAYGRTQGFNSYGPRLYTKTFSKGPNFIEDKGDSLFCNGYAVFTDDDPLIYKRILNSSIMDYYMKRTSTEINGNYQCYQKNYIEKFALPDLDENEKSFLCSTENRDLIDEFLERKYGVSLK